MISKINYLLLFALAVVLSSCAPADVPRDAERSWSLKSDFTWSWSRNFEHGCVAWQAKEAWANVFVLVESQCEGQGDSGFLTSKRGLSYTSFDDYLLFRGYWPWTSKMWSDMFEFDDEGMLTGGSIHPCPYSLSQDQIEAMRVVATEALSAANTDGEKRILTRIIERIAVTNGEALSSSQSGCTDKALNPAERASVEEVDLWLSR